MSTEQTAAANAWLKITGEVSASLAEEAAALMADLSGCGVELTEPQERPGMTQVLGYLPAAAGPDGAAGLVDAFRQGIAAFGVPLPVVSVTTMADQDWNRVWKEFFHPFKVSDRLTICPSWEAAPSVQEGLLLVMDPGMAFGTGHHPTTRLVLALMEEAYSAPSAVPGRVLDIGTGTGILAMAAALFGATAVTALDNDPLAVAAATENVRRNGLDGRVLVGGDDAASLAGPFDLIVANILFEPLLVLAPVIFRLLAPGGGVIFSGILAAGQRQALADRCRELEFSKQREKTEGEWAALLCRKPSCAVSL